MKIQVEMTIYAKLDTEIPNNLTSEEEFLESIRERVCGQVVPITEHTSYSFDNVYKVNDDGTTECIYN